MDNQTISIIMNSKIVHQLVVGVFSIILLTCSILIYDFPVKFVENSSADPPTVLDFTPSSYKINSGSTMYLYLNATDSEDSEEELTPIVLWGNNGMWCNLYFGDPSYIGDTSPDGWWCIPFYTINVPDGQYNFKANVKDKDDNYSLEWVYVYDIIICHIDDFPPCIINITPQKTVVYRNQTMQITLNASDDGYFEPELTIQIQYDEPDDYVQWEQDYISSLKYIDSNINLNDDIGYYGFNFTPNTTARLGNYRFRVKVNNTIGQDSGWVIKDSLIAVKNNVPMIKNITSSANKVNRTSSINIYAKGKDIESSQDMLSPHFIYRPQGEDWYDIYLSNLTYDKENERWSIIFKPFRYATLGSYDFKVYFEDEDGDKSDSLIKLDLIQVLNALPEVTSFIVPFSSGYRLEPLTIMADAIDYEQDEMNLEPIFEYRSPLGVWVAAGESGNYFQNPPEYMNGHWQIIFNPPYDAEIGDYNFRIQFIDDNDGESEWVYQNDSYTLMNNNPEVEIITPPGEWASSTITFTASALDLEDSQLLWEWDFGDGETSDEETPTHFYNRGGTYTVTVTVTDGDGASAMDSIILSIENAYDHIKLSEPLRFYILIVFLIFIIITTIISIKIFNSLKKRSNDSDQKE